MAGFRILKTLLSVSVLFTATLVTHTLAGEARSLHEAGGVPERRTEEACKEGEERVQGECCPEELVDEDEGEKKCFEAPSGGSMATAFTLIGSFTFMISLQFAMNWPDKDMQRYAYQVISATVSIFSAVLMFQCINGLVEEWIIEGFELHGWWEVLVDLVHTTIWYTIMQLVIATVSEALHDPRYRDEMMSKEKDAVADEKQKVKTNCTCYGILLAHITGFASINVWTGLQSQEPFRSSPLMALLPVAIALGGTLMLQRITDWCRERVIMGDDHKDFYEDQWDDFCEEAENDVMSLTCSVLIVNAVRMSINGMVEEGVGCLPNQEQKDEGKECKGLDDARNLAQVAWLFSAGLMFVVALFFVELLLFKFFPEKEEGEEGENEQGETEEEEEKPLHEQVIERLVRSFSLTLSMSFCWCTFHGNMQLLRVISPYLRDERQECSLAVIIGLEVSYIAWIVMLILDKIADLDEKYTPKYIDNSIEAVIGALSLLIGFAWEQTFDTAVDSIANSFRPSQGRRAPAFVKFVVGSFCCTIVFFAWKKYILSYVVREGWNFHIVMTKRELISAATKLKDKDDIIRDHVLPTLEMDPEAVTQYKALPHSDDHEKVVEKNKILMEKLKQSDADKIRLQNLLNEHMQSMLTSFRAMNETVTRIEND